MFKGGAPLNPHDYDLWAFDLDGTLYLGEEAFADALAWLEQVEAAGAAIAYITNNPYDPPAVIRARLQRMGFPTLVPTAISQGSAPVIGGSETAAAAPDSAAAHGNPPDSAATHGNPPESTAAESAPAASAASTAPTAAKKYPILTSALAAAHRIAELVPAGSAVLCLGARGLHLALQQVGLQPVTSMQQQPAGVVVGGTAQWDYAVITEAVRGVLAGLPFVVTNRDPVYPFSDGPRPGTGALVAAVETAGGRPGEAAGKPAPYLYKLAGQAFPQAQRPIMVGDRLDTDVAGAQKAGWESIWLLRPDQQQRRQGAGQREAADLAAATDGSQLPPYYELSELNPAAW